MLAIVFCIIGLAYGQYPPAAPYPPAPYPPAYQAIRTQVQPVQDAVHPVRPISGLQQLPAQLVRPLSQPVAVQPVRTIQHVQPVRAQPIRSGAPYPYAPAQGVQLEGGELSPVEQDATPTGKYPSPVEKPSLSGGDLSPEQLEIPPNTQVKLQDGQLQYSHGFSDDSGTSVREQGSLLSTNDGWEYVIAKKGSYSYVSPEGKTISVSYIADHNGFRVLPN